MTKTFVVVLAILEGLLTTTAYAEKRDPDEPTMVLSVVSGNRLMNVAVNSGGKLADCPVGKAGNWLCFDYSAISNRFTMLCHDPSENPAIFGNFLRRKYSCYAFGNLKAFMDTVAPAIQKAGIR